MTGLGGMRDAELLGTDVLVDKPKRFVCERLRMPDGVEIDWYYADTAESVMIVPVTASGNVIMVKQYRHNLKADTLELPAGVSTSGESMTAAAERELIEETGHTLETGGQLRPLARLYALPSETNKWVSFFLAYPVVSAGAAEWDTEIERYFDMSTVEIPFDEAIAAIGTRITGAETAAALLMARPYLS
jgi:ADP-ribose pyrophosphatase